MNIQKLYTHHGAILVDVSEYDKRREQMTEDEFFDYLQKRICEAGSIKQLACQTGIHFTIIYRLIRRRQPPNAVTLKKLGLKKITTYEKI